MVSHTKHCVHIQNYNRFCGVADVLRYLMAILFGQHGPQQITFYNYHRLHTIRLENSQLDRFLILLKHGGQPPAVVYFNSIETDQQVQASA